VCGEPVAIAVTLDMGVATAVVVPIGIASAPGVNKLRNSDGSSVCGVLLTLVAATDVHPASNSDNAVQNNMYFKIFLLVSRYTCKYVYIW
jgi:hypothetical protein